MRRAAFFATLAAGFGLVGVSVHGITSVDTQLKLAADQQRTPPAPATDPVLDGHDCHRHHDHRGGPDV